MKTRVATGVPPLSLVRPEPHDSMNVLIIMWTADTAGLVRSHLGWIVVTLAFIRPMGIQLRRSTSETPAITGSLQPNLYVASIWTIGSGSHAPGRSASTGSD